MKGTPENLNEPQAFDERRSEEINETFGFSSTRLTLNKCMLFNTMLVSAHRDCEFDKLYNPAPSKGNGPACDALEMIESQLDACETKFGQ